VARPRRWNQEEAVETMSDDAECGWDPVCYAAAVGNTAKETVIELYGDAKDAGGYVLETGREILTLPGRAVKAVGEGLEAAGQGATDMAAAAPKTIGPVVFAVAALAGVYFVWGRK